MRQMSGAKTQAAAERHQKFRAGAGEEDATETG